MSAVSPDSILLEEDIALIAVVGRGMVGEIGVAARLLARSPTGCSRADD